MSNPRPPTVATLRALALCPMTSKGLLEDLWVDFPAEVLRNPVTSLLLLECPSWPVPRHCRRLVAVTRMRKARPDLPDWVTENAPGPGQPRRHAYGHFYDNGAGHGEALEGLWEDVPRLRGRGWGNTEYGNHTRDCLAVSGGAGHGLYGHATNAGRSHTLREAHEAQRADGSGGTLFAARHYDPT